MKSRNFGDLEPNKNLNSTVLGRLALAMQRSKVPYILTGADAVSYYGAPRRSDDKDLVVMTTSPAQLQRVVDELREQKFEISRLEIGHSTFFDSGFRIDIKVKPDVKSARRIRLTRGLWLQLTTAENLVLMKLEFWDGKSLESIDAQDLVKILTRQRNTLDMAYVRAEALKRNTYGKLRKIDGYLLQTRHRV